MAWGSSQFGHYVTLIPLIENGDDVPKLALPDVAWPKSMPPGLTVDDYMHYEILEELTTFKFELYPHEDYLMNGLAIRFKLLALIDPWDLAVKLFQNLGFQNKSRLTQIVNFILEVAKNNKVPIEIKNENFVKWIESNSNQDIISPREPDRTKPESLLKYVYDAHLRYDSSFDLEQVNNVLNEFILQLKDDQKMSLETFENFLNLFKVQRIKPQLFGFLNEFLALPINQTFSIIKKFEIVKFLLDQIQSESLSEKLAIIRCLNQLFIQDYGLIIHPLVFNPTLKVFLFSMIPEIEKKHLYSFSKFIHRYKFFEIFLFNFDFSYTSYICRSRFFNKTVLYDSLTLIDVLISTCFNIDPSNQSIQVCIYSIMTILIVEPSLKTQYSKIANEWILKQENQKNPYRNLIRELKDIFTK